MPTKTITTFGISSDAQNAEAAEQRTFDLGESLSVDGKIQKLDHPHREEGILRELYQHREMSAAEVADKLGCHAQTVFKWMDRHGIDRRGRAEAVKKSDKMGRPRVGYAPFCTRKSGSEWWTDGFGHTTNVGVHQLAAVAHGADPYEVFDDSTHVHHRNCVPWDNRAENLEVVTISQHERTHAKDEWIHDEDLGCPVLETAGRQQSIADFSGD